MRFIAIILFSFFAISGWSQMYNPVHWTTSLKDNGDGTYSFIASAKIDEGWWVYSQFLPSEDGPIATTVNFDAGDHYKLMGKSKESDNAIKTYDKIFEMDVVKFKHDYTINQKIKITDPSKPITGYLNFQTCNDDRCLPPTDVDFSLTAPTKGSSGDATPKTNASEPKKTDKANAGTTSTIASDSEKKKITEEQSIQVDSPASIVVTKSIDTASAPLVTIANGSGPLMKGNGVVDHSVPSLIATYEKPINDCGKVTQESKGNLLWMLIFGMINGLVALLTPCVFPMIPLTVSYFTKGTKRKGFQNAIIYGISIILI
ncbi:MAG TPA: protein-disulfide reductase DsbD domain-containing protein, partial [Saprospiraceae bacterium]|nr:protein-disulfide reductase DsbD domain-containing protein [Saprospiraceae bacterium]